MSSKHRHSIWLVRFAALAAAAPLVGACSYFESSEEAGDSTTTDAAENSSQDPGADPPFDSELVLPSVIPTNAAGPALEFDTNNSATIPLPSVATSPSGSPRQDTTDETPDTTTETTSDTTVSVPDKNGSTTPDSETDSDVDTTTAVPGEPSATSAMPASMVVVRGGEAVVLVATGDGAARTVHQVRLEVDPEDAAGPSTPVSVDVDPSTASVRFALCCVDGFASISTVNLADASESEPMAGAAPAVSPDGNSVAYVTHQGGVTIVDVTSLTEHAIDLGPAVTATSVDWSPDGSLLAVGGANSLGVTVVVMVDAVSRSSTAMLAPASGTWTMPRLGAGNALVVQEGMGTTSDTVLAVVDPSSGSVVDRVVFADLGGVVDLDFDSSGTWLLVVDGRGRAHAFDGTSLVNLPGDGYTAASW
ncbi:MAG: hypothetical protein GY708_08310 [Actinomycetia bacterium]|nr:hypothetical protein [Actinomycetes bacterium]MCP4960193.1 hypothetical protein [Actinomycetes bacterium]